MNVLLLHGPKVVKRAIVRPPDPDVLLMKAALPGHAELMPWQAHKATPQPSHDNPLP
jgi:hypothetical protein